MSNIEINEEYKVVSVDDVKNNLKELNIETIKIGDADRLVEIGDDIEIVENEINSPLVIYINKWGNTLIINSDWYKSNKQEVNDLVGYVAMFNPNEILIIKNKALINDKIITCLCHNPNLFSVDLASYDSDRYSLSEEVYYKLKESSIKRVRTSCVDEELRENFDDIIAFNSERSLIGFNNYKMILDSKEISINKKLTKQELENFKYLSDDKIILIDEKLDIREIDKIATRLKELQLSCCIMIEVKNKDNFNSMFFEEKVPEYNELYIKISDQKIPMEKYVKLEKMLYEMVEPARELSPFEKYIFAYNITKKYKKYNENFSNPNASRKLYDILQNEYIVCVGFANLFKELLSKLNINAVDYSVKIDKSYDNIKNDSEIIEAEEKIVNKSGHARLMVYLNDDKYGIDGLYITDPTWDNDLEKDLYVHMAMTHREMIGTNRYNWIDKNNFMELLDVKSTNEFYEKAIFLLKRSNTKYTEDDVKRMVIHLMDILKVDKKFINDLYKKYHGLDNLQFDFNVNELVYDLACYIVGHVNKTISGKTIISGVKSVYEKVYGYTENELMSELDKTVLQNYEKMNKAFPIRYKVIDNAKEVVMNEENKFEAENIRKTI